MSVLSVVVPNLNHAITTQLHSEICVLVVIMNGIDNSQPLKDQLLSHHLLVNLPQFLLQQHHYLEVIQFQFLIHQTIL